MKTAMVLTLILFNIHRRFRPTSPLTSRRRCRTNHLWSTCYVRGKFLLVLLIIKYMIYIHIYSCGSSTPLSYLLPLAIFIFSRHCSRHQFSFFSISFFFLCSFSYIVTSSRIFTHNQVYYQVVSSWYRRFLFRQLRKLISRRYLS